MTDPVCGMDVKSTTSRTSMHEGKQYAFCSDECKKKFDREPERYTRTPQEARSR
jgi:YHS domain-containing protein